MKKYFSNIVVVVSLLFLAYFLWSESLLDFSLIHWNKHLYLSFFFLFSGFVISGISWWWSLKVHNINISVRDGLISHGLSIFAKYIPGKIWTILGRAAQIAKSKNLNLTGLSFISLKEQLVYLDVGILVSIVPIYFTYGFGLFFFSVLLSGFIISLIIFNKRIHHLVILLLNKVLRKELKLPLIGMARGLKLSIFNMLLWLSWSLAFYYFILSFDPTLQLKLAFVFPVSVVYGVLAIVLPGGIGVREGIITSFLLASGIQLDSAATISLVSRLWFIIGEAFIFLLAWIIKLFDAEA